MCRPDIRNIGKEYTDLLGVSDNFFHNMIKLNRPQFDYISAKDSNIVAAYNAYTQEREEIKEEACQVFIWLEDKKLISSFGRFLVKRGVYGNYRSYRSTQRVIFSSVGIVKHRTAMSIKETNRLFKEYKEAIRWKAETR